MTEADADAGGFARSRDAQVQVGENENAESAIRRFRKAVMSSGHIQEVRRVARRAHARESVGRGWRIGLSARRARRRGAHDVSNVRVRGLERARDHSCEITSRC